MEDFFEHGKKACFRAVWRFRYSCLFRTLDVLWNSTGWKRRGVDIPNLLLNQFDGSQALHKEIQYRLAKQYNDRLIPVTISRDPDVSVALARGTTIIDYSPSSCVSEDLYKLNDWLAAHFKMLPKLDLAAAGQRQ